MIDTRREISLGFSPEKVYQGQHICYIYNSDAERRRIMTKFIEAGLLDGEKVLFLADTMTSDEMASGLEELGIDVPSRHDLTIQNAEPMYCPDGHFHVDRMLESLRVLYRTARSEGFVGARIAGETSWCLVDGFADAELLMEYEAKVNDVLQDYPSTACCQYDARRFDGETLMDVLSVHPVMIVRGQLVRNPYYVEPREFLKEYRSRTHDHE